ncbi:hypothetical protein MLD38_017561 [Melastoma candidum]|uniref:Uncharacterized protein n=1 Tax=Melastoma candidum TaxID=119954 RepID=A0ACB9QQG9_9MYRT|nr:hypothetical protein MLD38_017561 [Melastoma candidum]
MSAERSHYMFSPQPQHLPKVCSDVDYINILDGEWHAHESGRSWEYRLGGKAKEKVELDEENKTVAYIELEGDVFNHYKTFQSVWQAFPKPRA